MFIEIQNFLYLAFNLHQVYMHMSSLVFLLMKNLFPYRLMFLFTFL